MLNYLRVKNFVLIKDLKLDLSDNLNVFTGETGVGKTILVNAVKVLLGDKIITKLVSGNDQADIEGVFSLRDENAKKPHQYGFEGDEIILRRIISKKKRGRYFVNDTIVTQKTYQDIAKNLIDIHSQNENQTLLDENIQKELYDNYIKVDKSDYYDTYKKYNELKFEIASMEEEKGKISKEYDYIKFQYDEIKRIDPMPGEDEEYREKLRILKGIEEYKSTVFGLKSILYEDENSILTLLERGSKLLSEISKFSHEIGKSVADIEDMKEKIITLYRSLDMAENIENEDITIDDIQERLSQIEKLYKYGKTIEEIINYEKELEKKLSFFDGSKFDIKGKKEELKNIKDDLTKKASQIHNHRVKWKVKFQEKVNKELENVAMKGSKFYVDIDEDKETFKSDGFDNVRFLIDTTGKGKFPLNMIASGGELSRIMLVLKEIFIDDDSVETLIFDEIDMGIGGQTALSVGAKIEKISKKKQVITITHLHQIAKFADYHFSVEKKKNKAETYTTINKLDQKQKIEEIARMLGGTKMSENTVKLAKDLLKK